MRTHWTKIANIVKNSTSNIVIVLCNLGAKNGPSCISTHIFSSGQRPSANLSWSLLTKQAFPVLFVKKTGRRRMTGNIGVMNADGCPCLQAHMHIFKPANGWVTHRPNVHPHTCIYAFMCVDIHKHTSQAGHVEEYNMAGTQSHWSLKESQSKHTARSVLNQNFKQYCITRKCLFWI